MLGSGTIVSAAVLSALPLELPPLLLAMLLVVAFACAFELSEFVVDVLDTELIALACVTPETNCRPAFCVCALPVAFPRCRAQINR